MRLKKKQPSKLFQNNSFLTYIKQNKFAWNVLSIIHLVIASNIGLLLCIPSLKVALMSFEVTATKYCK